MDFKSLNSILAAISSASDLTTLILNIQKFGIKISGKTFKEARKDIHTLEQILNDCFIRKEVLWQKPDYENFNWCINSLMDLQKNCDEFAAKFLTNHNDTHHFYSQLMKLWGNYCNETYKELYRNKAVQHYELYKPLKKLRQNCYKIIVTFIWLLPELNLLKQQALNKLEEGCKNSKIKVNQIEPEWTIE